MHVLVIGGNRFMGRLLVGRLLAAGERVTILNRGALDDPFGDRIERLRADRTKDLERALAGRSFDACVDFAAFRGEDAWQGVSLLREKRLGHYVLISTGQVYLVREGCSFPAREEDYDGPLIPRPTDPVDVPEWDYGMGKRAAEDVLVRAWNDEALASTRLRIPMVHGERDYYRRLECYLARLVDGGPVLLPDGGTHRTRHVYGQDVARATAALIHRRETFGRVYNLCQDEQPTLAEVVAILRDLVGSRAELVPVPAWKLREAGLAPEKISPLSGRWMSSLDPARAKRELGFVHEPLRAYLGHVVASWLSHPPLTPPETYSRFRPLELRLGWRAI